MEIFICHGSNVRLAQSVNTKTTLSNMSFTRELLERAHARGFRPTDEIHARERKYQRRLLRGVAAKLGGSGG